MQKIAGWFAAAGLAASFVVHLLTIGRVDILDSFPLVWALHVLIFPPFVLFVLTIVRTQSKPATWQDLLGLTPPWASLALKVLTYYAVVNFLLFMFLHEGDPTLKDGLYSLSYKGKFIRWISEDEYHAARAMTLRGFSGHWMVFFAAPALYFLTRKESKA